MFRFLPYGSDEAYRCRPLVWVVLKSALSGFGAGRLSFEVIFVQSSARLGSLLCLLWIVDSLRLVLGLWLLWIRSSFPWKFSSSPASFFVDEFLDCRLLCDSLKVSLLSRYSLPS